MSLGFALKEIGNVVSDKAAFLRDSPRYMNLEAKQLENHWAEIKKIIHGYIQTGFLKNE